MPTETTHNETTAEKVVRLKVDGASSAVNTLRDQQTARGISLICPFPALEVDIPVRFGRGRGKKTDMTNGSIHRISVEDDAETGLPRLRLSIRANDSSREPVAHEAPAQSRSELASLGLIQLNNIKSIPNPPQRETPTPPPLPKVICEESVTPESETTDYQDQLLPDTHPEPAWVDCDSVPDPEEFLRNRTAGRGYRIAAKAGAWLAVFALVIAAGYVMERTGFVDISKVDSYFAGFSLDRSATRSAATSESVRDPLDTLSELSPKTPETTKTPAPSKSNVIPAQITISTEHEMVIPAPAEREAPSIEPTLRPIEQPSEREQNKAPPAASLAANEEEKTAEKTDPGGFVTDVTLVLPTRWPVEYASGYRIRDPNGIVIDVPGGLVRREGWLESGTDHPMIRSIKAIQRETGARYVVYVHGALPRFVTSPKTEGVSLRLYHNIDEATSTEQIAMAD